MNFEELVASRHSALNFEKDFKMTEQDFKPILDLTKLSPSAYNLQFAHYLIITDEARKDFVYELSYRQYKIKSASAVVILLGDKNAVTQKNAETIYSPLKMFKAISEQEYESLMQMISGYEQQLRSNELTMTQELATNASISMAFFMLAAKNYGYDTCPMHVHNIPELREAFNIPEHLVPLNLIAVGKSGDKKRLRGYRRPVGEFSTFNGFQ